MINWGLVLRGQLMQREVTISGQRVLVPRGVLDPEVFKSGAWFGVQVAHRVSQGDRVLDLGCGVGFVGLLARCAGAHVVASDIDPRACQAARDNGVANVRCGDLFEPLQGESFDVICFNPPYFRGKPMGRPYGKALYGGPNLEVVTRFANDVRGHLKDNGKALVAWSDRAPRAQDYLGDQFTEVVSQDIKGERLSIWRMTATGS